MNRLLCTVTIFLLAASSLRADVIYSTSDPFAPFAPVFAPFSDFELPQQIADDFALGSAETLRSVTWHGAYYGANTAATDLFTIRIFSGVSSVPLHEFSGVSLAFRTDTGLDAFGSDLYFYGANVPDTILGPGTYLLSIVNDTTADLDDVWAWMDNGDPAGNWYYRFPDGDPWTELGTLGDMAFTLYNTNAIPEPSSLALLALGLVGYSALRQKRKLA